MVTTSSVAANVLPNFLFIGPDKSGSSWLHALLHRHSQAWVPAFKDVYFFDRYYDRGIEWYAKIFADCPANAQAVGEISHDYLFSPLAAQRIASHLEGVRLITILRDPVERAFSQYLYLVRSGRTKSCFEDALDTFAELRNNSLYYQHLSVYFDQFERARIGVFWFDDLQHNPAELASQICAFLNIDNEPDIDVHAPVRPASRPRSAVLARVAKKGATIARQLGLPGLVGAVKHGAASRMLYEPYDASSRPMIEPGTAAELRLTFAQDVLQLQELLNRDLRNWLPQGVEFAS